MSDTTDTPIMDAAEAWNDRRDLLAQIGILERQLAEARGQLSKNEEDEARLCPEDQSWQETLNTAREQLAEWRTLTTWGGTPEIINDFIKGQQTRIHAAQNTEERDDWKKAGMRIGYKLVAAGCKSDGIVDGVKEIIEQRDRVAEALRECSKRGANPMTEYGYGNGKPWARMADDIWRISGEALATLERKEEG